MGLLWASHGDLPRLAEARSAVLLVGGYDGSGNYGDVLQVATAIETVEELPGSPLPIAIVERETRAHHLALLDRYRDRLGGAVFVHYDGDVEPSQDGLVELAAEALPHRAVLYIYGGGFFNRRWGARKIAHVDAAERLRAEPALPVVASGLQVDEAAVAPAGVAHDLLARASWIGVRDPLSRQYMRTHLAGAAAPGVELAGDDATPFLRPAASAPEPVVNLHVNDGVWVIENRDEMLEKVAGLLCGIGRAGGTPLRLQPTIAYEDPRVSERRVVADLLERFGGELEAAGIVPGDPIDVLEDALHAGLARFRRARLTVACSYHVTLSSLLAGIPAVLLAENGYYDQKASGLRDLFDLDDSLLGVHGEAGDAATAASALVDGEVRDALISRLRAGSTRVVERYERGREATATALAEASRSAPPSFRDAIRGLIRGG